MRTAILNNFLVKFGLRFQEKDITQEHHNGKLETMVDKSGGDFDSPYYRDIIAPNVNNFINSGKVWEDSLNLKHRSNSHTSPSNCPELRVLQNEFKSSELHLFKPKRHYPGHIASDLLTIGHARLGSRGKLKAYLKKTAARAKFITAIEKEKKSVEDSQDVAMSNIIPSSNPDYTHTSESNSEYESSTYTDTDTETESSEEEVVSDSRPSRLEEETTHQSDDESEDEVNTSDMQGSDEYSSSDESF
jgi:hypothetical protein